MHIYTYTCMRWKEGYAAEEPGNCHHVFFLLSPRKPRNMMQAEMMPEPWFKRTTWIDIQPVFIVVVHVVPKTLAVRVKGGQDHQRSGKHTV